MVLVKELRPITKKRVVAAAAQSSGEAMAFCPTCKAFQTLWFADGKLTPTRKFSQLDGKVYHDCGSMTPCRIYPVI